MCHKAYAFDWRVFAADDLPGFLVAALGANDPSGLAGYVGRNLAVLKDPYEGGPLDAGWEDRLENRDAHEYGDFALTRFYDPAADAGLGYAWAVVADALGPGDRQALLGSPFGPPANPFDPGRYGSYFQSPEQAADSLERVQRLRPRGRAQDQAAALESLRGLLRACVAAGLGLYVTF